jgi:hypothetical protein
LVIPLLSPLPIVQAFWLLSMAYLFSGRWPSGLPEAWPAGEARPWPSQQEVREERMRAEQSDAEEEKAPEPAPAATRKRKRKRRR